MLAFQPSHKTQGLPMSYTTALLCEATRVIVLAIDAPPPLAHALSDTLRVVTGHSLADEDTYNHIAEHVHEIGAMAVIA
jgi:hypothetical protein